jgi:hypothetical protein
LVFDVSFDRIEGNASHSRYEFASCPKRRNTSFYFGKFFSEYIRSRALYARNNLVYADYGIDVEKQMHMIGHNLRFDDNKIIGFLQRKQYLLKPFADLRPQYFAPVLGAKDDMVQATVYGCFGCAEPFR